METRENFILKHKKGILLGIGVVLAVIAGVFVVLDLLKNAYFSIVVTPVGAKITVNGQEYSNGTFKRFPGEVIVKIEHEGMVSKEVTLNLESGKTTVLRAFLTGEDDDFSHYDTNLRDYEILKLVATESEAIEYIKATDKKLTIREVLPLQRWSDNKTPSPVNGKLGRETSITDGTNDAACKQLICLMIQDNTGNDAIARELIKNAGYNYDDFQIINKGY